MEVPSRRRGGDAMAISTLLSDSAKSNEEQGQRSVQNSDNNLVLDDVQHANQQQLNIPDSSPILSDRHINDASNGIGQHLNKEQVLASKRRKRGSYLPLAPDNEDLVYDALNPTHMEASYQYSNQLAFQDEKAEYLATLRQRVTNIQIMDERHAINSRDALQKKYFTLYSTKADALRKFTAKELCPQAMRNVMRFEELVEKESKRLHRNQLKKERRAQKSAALRAERAEAKAKAEADNEFDNAEEEDVIHGKKGQKKGTEAKVKSKENEPEPTLIKQKRGKTRKSDAEKPKANSQIEDDAKASSNIANKQKSRSKSKAPSAGSKSDSSSRSKLVLLAPAAPLSETSKDSPDEEDEEEDESKKDEETTKNGSSKSSSGPTTGQKSAVPPPPPKLPSQKEIRAIARLYSNTYESVWKDMARRDANKVHRLVQSSTNTRISNLRKTAVLASKEARRWQFKTNKTIKDLQMKAKRGMREMLAFWKRNEREERDLRKKAEKEALELAKKEEEMRESRRQARKLNFLITQTELYTHFIGKKLGSVEDENPTEVKDVKDLDFDSDNEDEIHKVALANARSAFEDTQAYAKSFNGESGEIKNVNIDNDEMNFQNPTSLGDIQIPQPKLLSCQLKEYQLKGLSWLANLYEQGINGILADEMGLGKTVQSISVMAYLAETHNIWGPFLVISPSSTLHNWEQEIAKFVPDFKVLPYWGSTKDRKILRKFWDHKNVKYTKDSEFHVLITSYQLVVQDASYFQKMKWQYMILDEAQAIKSSSSARWKSLLSFQCRNRLLLTGTPIQNSMQELWALLHFIMPTLFDSHDEFSEWFSKDIESHAQSNTQLNEQQLNRLHMILKPFMLRRLKKHVQQELGDKIEIDVYCDLTNRQRELYRMLRSQISVMELIEKASSDEGTQSLMNLVMQFRKVCNHPDLFERADVSAAYSFSTPKNTFGPIRESKDTEILYNCENLINYCIPKLIYRDGGVFNVPSENNFNFGRVKLYLENLFSIWDPGFISETEDMKFLRLLNMSSSEIVKSAKKGLFERAIDSYHNLASPDSYNELDNDSACHISRMLQLSKPHSLKGASNVTGLLANLLNIRQKVLDESIYNFIDPCYNDRVQAPPITLVGSDRSIPIDQEAILFDHRTRSALYPMSLDEEYDYISKGVSIEELPPSNLMPSPCNPRMGFTTIQMPSMNKFVTDSGKLAKLDQMLPELKAEDHRVLIYFQMTKMMDLMEEYLTFRQYKYVRLDGSSKLTDRRDLVNDWQTKPELFIFLLSTRAGGLGINLTAADTVIFYDSDWNPTIDSQAMDRAHRMGQTRQVTVYRLLVKGTIEERMRDRAKQKMHVQQVVMEGGSGKSGNSVDFQKPGREVAYWLLDDDATADALIKKTEEDGESGNGRKPSMKRSSQSMDEESTTGSLPKKPRVKEIEDMYHEGEGEFKDSNNGSPESVVPSLKSKNSKKGHKKMTTEQRLRAVGSGEF